ncbi:hypothetical protein ACN9MY_18130 [Pseudoduganella sp. R-31]|uniref:hypothetical protein n=1 Tax=Pseudoduganella sp. R-31 TaxID=3404060 RepID=UPI003CF3D3B7
MAYIVVLLIAILNCVVLFFFSFLAAGDGSAKGMFQVWIFGFSWIALSSLVSLVLCAEGKRSTAIGTACLTLPVGYIVALASIPVVIAFNSFKPNSPKLEAVCKDVGPRFIAKPASTVESLAYDWEPATYPPRINYFTLDARGTAQNLRSDPPRFPKSIKFTEVRCCQLEGAATNGIHPFIRRQNDGDNSASYFGVPESTADVLVKYKVSRIDPKDTKSNLESVDITVWDRRDGLLLATMRYFLDQQTHSGCGTTSEGVMDEQAFVLKAIGISDGLR